MTVSYTAEVAHTTWFGCFPKLLLRWRASIYKLIWVDVLTYIALYYAINATYRFLLNEEQKKMFEIFVKYCNTSSSLIPLMFVLGFYVSIVIKRWWEQYMTLPWPDSTAVYVSSLIRGQDENGRKMRRTIMRYVCLSLTMVLTMNSPRVKKRFPTLDHLVDAGLLVENEKVILRNMNEKFAKYPKHWMPIVWASSIVTRARKEGRIRDDSSLKTLIDSLNSFRGMCMVLLFYDTISIPLVYTQVVTIAVYSYFLTSVFGHQWTGQTSEEGILNIVDYFFPYFTVLEYLFFMGWLKVAESLICPFGDDDDDFEMNWLIDRNLQVSYLIVDEMHNEHPELIKDQYWDEVFPTTIPYETAGIVKTGPEKPPQHSTAELGNQIEKKASVKMPIMQSVTRCFSKHCVRQEDQNESEPVNDINFNISQDISKSESKQNLKELKSIKLIPISSDMFYAKEGYESNSSEEADKEDEFEKLKKQRQQERMLRQKTKFNIKDQMEAVEDLKSVTSRISKNSQSKKSKKSSSSKSSIDNSNESKKTEVATCKKFGCFIKLLARWRGSIYKLIWMDLVLFLTLYYCINIIYIYLLEDESKRTFESIVYYCSSYTSLIPLSFVLGFYVNLVMTRWWEQYITIPWPDSIAVFVSAHVHGQDEASRVMRRTVMRYVCLCLTIVFTMISPCVKKRFPKLKHLVDAGLLLENEKKIIETMDNSFPKYPKHWMPIVWAASIITRARKEGHIRDDFAVKTIIDELNSFRGLCGTLMYYDFISIPLVYTQVVTIAVYSFFICSLLAHQWTDTKKDTYEALDFYSPVFITLHFFFYMGWLKVAETLINPFGEDDDDFEVNWMIDRNLQVSYLIVDEMHHEHPELVKDQYWDEVYPNELPYETDTKREQPPESSTAKYDLEASLKRAISKVTSPSNSVVMNGKTRSSVQSALNQRSQRFNEAFQRFFNFSQEDVTSTRTDVENSFQSVSEIENIEHITSYTSSDPVELESENDNTWTRSVLEPVPEEGEEVYEALQEDEMLNIEEEDDDEIETQSSCESDSDSDLFERLRIERQQQRLQRMNDYLERHFGPNFRIVTKNLETKTECNKTVSFSEDNMDDQTINEKENDDDLLTPTISMDYTKLDKQSNSYQGDKETSVIGLVSDEKLLTPTLSTEKITSLIDLETDEKLLTPKLSTVFTALGTSFVALEVVAKAKNDAESNDSRHDSILPKIDINVDSLLLEDNNVETVEKEESSTLFYESFLPTFSLTSFQPISFSQDSRISLNQDIPSTSRIASPNSFLPTQAQFSAPILTGNETAEQTPSVETIFEGQLPNVDHNSLYSQVQSSRNSLLSIQVQTSANILPTVNEMIEQLQPVQTAFETQQTNIEPNALYSSESDLFWKSKASSPLGSGRSVSTQSSFVDDWEILSTGSTPVAGEYRVNTEESKDEHNAKKLKSTK